MKFKGRPGHNVVLEGVLAAALLAPAAPLSHTLPNGFRETVVSSGLTNPRGVAFASDGRVFVAEKSRKVLDEVRTNVVAPAALPYPDHPREGGSWTGWVTDDHCGERGALTNHKKCAESCVRRGAKWALYTPAGKGTYILSNQEAAAELAGQEVTVKGRMNRGNKTIQVESMAPAALLSQTLPNNFHETVVFSGLTNPTAVAFASDGRVFVAEKSGLIKVFDDLTDTTPTVFADLRTNVYNYWDKGLLGLALHPNFPATPYVYVLYTHDAAIGGTAPRWGTAGATSDSCPDPPGANNNGCVASGRLSRLEASGNVMTGPEQVLIEDWFIQFTTHSIGSLVFGSDGALYVSGGDGASATFSDYGQKGDPLNPAGDPPAGVGGVQTPPTAEGGALRAQDIRTSGDPVNLDGTIARVDPNTGAGLPDNPFSGDPDPNARRIIAYGLRQPFRIAARPGTDEIYIGDVGRGSWEELNRIADANDSVAENFGWPCYYGLNRNPSFDSMDMNLCESIYGTGAATFPFYLYAHSAQVVAGEPCGTGSSSISGLAFYEGGDYPNSYDGALFFADYSRNCMWVMFPGAGGAPDPNNRATFVAGAATPVDLKIGPGGDLFYVDLGGGTIRRIEYSQGNQSPTAVIEANPTTGSPPLTVYFDGSDSSDPDPGDNLDYAWDLDGDGQYDDSTDLLPQFTYAAAGSVTVRLRVTDKKGATGTTSVLISVDSNAPSAVINAPAAGTTWKVGDVINFSGSATDPQDGVLPASALSWDLVIQHCPAGCHSHPLQSYPGVASGSFTAPDHDYPVYLELQLTATDSGGRTDTQILRLDPQTVTITLDCSTSGLELNFGGDPVTAPSTSTVIVGSTNSISAPSPQTLDGTTYNFVSWSDAGAQSHDIVAGPSPVTYVATYGASAPPAVSISNASVTEGNSGTVNATFTVSLSAATSQTVTVAYATADGTATAPADYISDSETVTFPAGTTTQPLIVAVTGDTVDEPNETFQVNLATPTNATLADAQGIGTILDDDLPPNVPPAVSITSPTNGASFAAPASVTINASASDSDGTVTQVEFFSGATPLATDTTSPYSYNWVNVGAGSYSLTARATDNQGASTTSAAVAITVNSSGGGLPSPWLSQDIGAVGLAGSASYSGGAFTVNGAGADIWDNADKFRYAYQPLAGDGEIVARVFSIQNTNSWAKAGVMIRETLATGSANAMMAVTPGRGLTFQRRLTTGGTSASTSGGTGTAPYWVKLVRSGSTFTGFKSLNGVTWTQVGSATVGMVSNVFIGLAVTSHDATRLCAAVLDNVSLTLGAANSVPTVAITSPVSGASFTSPATIAINATAADSDGSVTQVQFYSGATLLGTDTTSPYSHSWVNVGGGSYSLTARATDNQGATTISAPVSIVVNTSGGALPAPWLSQDVGAVGAAGSASFSGGAFTAYGSGADIYGTSDQFHYVYRTLSGNGQIVARLTSLQNTNAWAKAGVMIRESLAANSANAMMLISPTSGMAFQRRVTTGGASVSTKTPGATPYWLKLTRSGNTFTAYRSADGITWISVGSASVPMVSDVLIGLAVTSHANPVLCMSVFDNVTAP